MSWKKLFLITIIAVGFGFASTPRSEAGVAVGIGIGAPIGFGYYGGYGCYPVGYGGMGMATDMRLTAITRRATLASFIGRITGITVGASIMLGGLIAHWR